MSEPHRECLAVQERELGGLGQLDALEVVRPVEAAIPRLQVIGSPEGQSSRYWVKASSGLLSAGYSVLLKV